MSYSPPQDASDSTQAQDAKDLAGKTDPYLAAQHAAYQQVRLIAGPINPANWNTSTQPISQFPANAPIQQSPWALNTAPWNFPPSEYQEILRQLAELKKEVRPNDLVAQVIVSYLQLVSALQEIVSQNQLGLDAASEKKYSVLLERAQKVIELFLHGDVELSDAPEQPSQENDKDSDKDWIEDLQYIESELEQLKTAGGQAAAMSQALQQAVWSSRNFG